MDSIDYKILKILQQQGRISMRTLANEIPMSTPAVCERVRKLEESGAIIGYHAKVSSQHIGKTINAFVLISCDRDALEELNRLIQNEPRVIEAEALLGRFAAILRVSCANMNDYADLIGVLGKVVTTESYLQVYDMKPFGHDLS